MKFLLGIIIGLLLGTIIGITFMCMLSINKDKSN